MVLYWFLYIINNINSKTMHYELLNNDEVCPVRNWAMKITLFISVKDPCVTENSKMLPDFPIKNFRKQIFENKTAINLLIELWFALVIKDYYSRV